MKRHSEIVPAGSLAALLTLLICAAAAAGDLTVQVGAPALPPTPLIEHTNLWRWHKGTNAPQADWKTAAEVSLDSTWGSSPGGFGYSTDTPGETNQCLTVLSDMRGTTGTNYSTIYLRRTFTIDSGTDTNLHLLLTVDWDDGFIAWMDGAYLTNRLVTGAPAEPLYTAVSSANHESSRGSSGSAPETYDLGTIGSRTGPHVLSIIGLNGNKGTSTDFVLIADLSIAGAQTSTGSGSYGSLVTSNSVTLNGSNTVAGSVRVTINGDDATFSPGPGTWTHTRTVEPGVNVLTIAAHDASGAMLSNITHHVIYETNRISIGGTLASSLAVSNRGTVLAVSSSLTIPTNLVLEIGAGVAVLVSPNQAITAQAGGRIDVRGTFDEPVFLHVNGATNQTWGPLSASGAGASIEVRFADIGRTQVSAVNGATGLIEDSQLHDFDPGASAGTLVRPLMMCNYASSFVARRNHYWNYYECLVRNGVIQIEQCLFEEMIGDALDFDSAQPGSFARRCTFRHGNRGNVDAIDIGPGDIPGSTDAIIDGCLMWDFPFDKGVSVGDGGSSHGIIVTNCLIYGCQSGVMSKDLCEVSVRNCTIVGNTSGFTNWNKANPAAATGGGINTNSFNNILWGNVTTIGLANSGQVYADHNDFAGTNWPGNGNIDTDPLFVNAAQRDYRLQPGSPCLGTGREGADMGIKYPVGGIPVAPRQLVALTTGTNAPLLTWEDASQNETGVVVQRSTDALNWQAIATLPPGATNHLDATAALGQRYYYRVQHTNDTAASPWSNLAAGARQAPVTYAGGTISADTIWASGSTIVVTSAVTVAAGVTLSIQPCATVQVGQGLNITVNGQLLAEGTPECRIVFTRANGATSWGTLDLLGATNLHRLSYVDLAYSTGNLDASSTRVFLRNLWFTNTTAQLVDLVGCSVIMLQSYVPGGYGVEPIHFSSMPAGGYAIFQSNIFGAPQGYNDSIDLTGGNRPGAIVQFLDNVFLAAVDDCLDLDGTDAHIEGNIFMNVHQDAVRSSTGNAISTGADGNERSEIVVVRNIFYDCDHALLLKDFGSAVFENNTIVTIQTNTFAASRAAYVQFGEPHRAAPGGRGILMNGNILWDLHSDTPFLAFTNGAMFMVANDNMIQGTNLTFGGNSTNDPLFVNWQGPITHLNIRSNLALLPGSPARGTGPNGLDRGALVPGGASISGEPDGVTTNTSAVLNIAGPGIYAYKWKLNDGPWSAEVPLTNDFLITATLFSNAVPVTLAGLTNGAHTVAVIGKNSAGFWQDTNHPTISKTWTVQPALAPAITGITNTAGAVFITFSAPAGQTHSVLYRDALDPAHPWQKLPGGDVPAYSTNVAVTVTDAPLVVPTRFYRVVTPAWP